MLRGEGKTCGFIFFTSMNNFFCFSGNVSIYMSISLDSPGCPSVNVNYAPHLHNPSLSLSPPGFASCRFALQRKYFLHQNSNFLFQHHRLQILHLTSSTGKSIKPCLGGTTLDLHATGIYPHHLKVSRGALGSLYGEQLPFAGKQKAVLISARFIPSQKQRISGRRLTLKWDKFI